MRKDDNIEFDLQIRSMLQDAEEENLSSLVWESLSSELDRRDRRKVVTLWWRRAAVGVAAAAIVTGAFFAMNGGRSTEEAVKVNAIAQDNVVRTAPAPDASIEEQIAAAGEVLFADVPAAPARPSAAVPDAVAPAESFENVPAVEAMTEDKVELPEQMTEKVKEAETKPEVKKEEEEWVDVFAQLAYEEDLNNTKRGVTLFLDGNAASNDKEADAFKLPNRVGSTAAHTGVTEKSTSTFGIPLTFGAGAKFKLTDRLAVGTGLNWSLLSRSFSGIYTEVDASGNTVKSVNSTINNEIHYIGIPLNLYYTIMSNRNLSFYVWGGGSGEKGLVNKYRIYSQPSDIIYKEKVNGIQWSAAAGLGLEFALTDKLGLYIDPSARYYFDCDQPVSVRTLKPYMLNFEVGLRFNLR